MRFVVAPKCLAAVEPTVCYWREIIGRMAGNITKFIEKNVTLELIKSIFAFIFERNPKF